MIGLLAFCFLLANLNIQIMAAYLSQPDNGFSITVASLKPNTAGQPDAIHSQLESYRLESRYFDTVSKKIYLDDGRVATCKVPLVGAEETVNWEDEQALTVEEAESILVHFKDFCVRHRTKDFLWEFCYGKYLRQYDDKITIANALKPGPELFFLGFLNPNDAKKYELVISKETGDYSPPREYFAKEIRLALPKEKYIQTNKNLVLLSDVLHLEDYPEGSLLSLIIYVPGSQLSDTRIKINPIGETLAGNTASSNRRNVNGVVYHRLERLIRVIVDMNTIILDEAFPFDVATNQANIEIFSNKALLPRNSINQTIVQDLTKREFNIYKNYLCGAAAFLTEANQAKSAILILNETHMESRLIVSVLDNFVVELDRGIHVENAVIKQVVLIPDEINLMKDLKWTFVHKSIWLLGVVVLGNDTSFTKEFKKGDILFLVDPVSGAEAPSYSREVLKVVSDLVMIVRPYRAGSAPAVSFTNYLIGKYANLTEELEAIVAKNTGNIFKDAAVSHINTELENSIYLLPNVQETQDNHLYCHKQHKLLNPESWLLTFDLGLLKTDANLLIHFGVEECGIGGVEINFFQMRKVIVSNYGEKANFLTAPIILHGISENQESVKVWFLFDKGTLRVGTGNELSLANQLIFFKSENYTSLKHFSFNKMFSYNVYLSNIQAITPQPQLLKTAELIQNTFTIGHTALFHENYSQGTFCPPINGHREVDVEYRCAQDGSFMKIGELDEPSTCHYHLVVTSNLFCPDQYRRSHKYEELSAKINCVV